MNLKNYFICLFILFFLIFGLGHLVSASESLDVDDTYNFDGSSTNDEVAFEDYDFDFQVGGLDPDPDLVCYNWDVYGGTDSYGGEDYCIYTSTTSRNQCISCWLIDVPTSKMDQKSSLTEEIDDQVCDGCDWDTSDRFGDSVNAYIYYDCDQCGSSYITGIGKFYSAVRPRQYLCEYNGNDEFFVRGEYKLRPYLNLEWVEYDSKYCSDLYNSYYDCARDRDQINDNTGTTILQDPCAIKDGNKEGNACSSDNDCISRNCGGESTSVAFSCDSDGSDGYNAYFEFYENSCGGEGWLDLFYTDDSTCSSKMGNSDYICDGDLTPFFTMIDGITYNPSDFCRLKEYASCSSDSGCWNDNGGYDCMGSSGNKICTTGVNGKNCYNNNDAQCDSFRCDNTCQSKLADGQGCDENSDCINGQCGGGTCGGSGVVVDLAIVDIIPVQVIKDVDLVKGKFGIVRVIVTNYGLNQSNGLVNVTFDGTQLNIASGDTQTKAIPPNRNITFDFEFIPTSSGDNKEIIANVTVV